MIFFLQDSEQAESSPPAFQIQKDKQASEQAA